MRTKYMWRKQKTIKSFDGFCVLAILTSKLELRQEIYLEIKNSQPHHETYWFLMVYKKIVYSCLRNTVFVGFKTNIWRSFIIAKFDQWFY